MAWDAHTNVTTKIEKFLIQILHVKFSKKELKIYKLLNWGGRNSMKVSYTSTGKTQPKLA